MKEILRLVLNVNVEYYYTIFPLERYDIIRGWYDTIDFVYIDAGFESRMTPSHSGKLCLRRQNHKSTSTSTKTTN